MVDMDSQGNGTSEPIDIDIFVTLSNHEDSHGLDLKLLHIDPPHKGGLGDDRDIEIQVLIRKLQRKSKKSSRRTSTKLKLFETSLIHDSIFESTRVGDVQS